MIQNIKAFDINGKQLDSLVQWDNDVYVYIEDESITSSYPAHWCHQCDTESLVTTSTFENGKLKIKCPNTLLRNAEAIFLYIYAPIDGGNRSIFRVRFNVIARPMPNDFVYIDTIDYVTIGSLERDLQEAIGRVDDIANNISLIKEDVITAANQSEQSKEDAIAAANRSEQAKDEAIAAANRSDQSKEDAITAANRSEQAKEDTMAAAEEMNSKLNQLVYTTPEAYGAVADGETDDTTAIRNAILSKKTVVFNGTKTYRIDGHIWITSADWDIHMIGNGAKILCRSHDENELSVVINILNCMNAEINGFHFEAENEDYEGTDPHGNTIKNTSNVTFINFASSKSAIISNCRFVKGFRGITGSGSKSLGYENQNEKVTVSNCIFEKCKCGIAQTISKMYTIDNCDFEYLGDSDKYDGDHHIYLLKTEKIFISNCRFVDESMNSGSAIQHWYSDSTGDYDSNRVVSISNCDFRFLKGRGSMISGGDNFEVTNCSCIADFIDENAVDGNGDSITDKLDTKITPMIFKARISNCYFENMGLASGTPDYPKWDMRFDNCKFILKMYEKYTAFPSMSFTFCPLGCVFNACIFKGISLNIPAYTRIGNNMCIVSNCEIHNYNTTLKTNKGYLFACENASAATPKGFKMVVKNCLILSAANFCYIYSKGLVVANNIFANGQSSLNSSNEPEIFVGNTFLTANLIPDIDENA